MISLDANEALVVYRQDEKSNEVTRYVQYGPTLFMLLSNEWYLIITHYHFFVPFELFRCCSLFVHITCVSLSVLITK